RDAWAIGYDGRWVAGVWVGRADGAAVPGLTGGGAAAPILFAVFSQLKPRAPLPEQLGWTGTAQSTISSRQAAKPEGLQIAYPPPGARIELGLSEVCHEQSHEQSFNGIDGGLRCARPPYARSTDAHLPYLPLKVRGGTPPFVWFADGRPIARQAFAREAYWLPEGPGYVSLSVVDGRGESARVLVRLD
ncbi:MAG: hypothetical protein N2690_12870, partial [Rhodocyclaceae bacterium]|nr:hypothetical protein [Rhodocyclaceae bacterium]